MTAARKEAEEWVWRIRLGAMCVALVAVAFRQRDGRTVADTKLDLTQAPWSFLRDATHLWDPAGALGQLQNQAYGYLFPMGPFHALLISAGLPGWVVQRLWWSLLLIVAFLGFWRLSGAMRVGGPWARLLGAVLFALAPRIASELTVTSVEVWPMAVAPWVLFPLVDPRERSMWSRAGWSAVAVACCGGVNAVATGAVLVLPALWFATRRWNKQTLASAVVWLTSVSVAMSWWLGPLILLGRYSPPFLDWIESAAVTTATASPFESLRGTGAWLGFLATAQGPEWPGGWLYTTEPALIVATMCIAALGLVGVVLSPYKSRLFLALGVVVGMALMGLGYASGLHSPFSDTMRHMLDGPLAALRNAHKFDVVVRLPLLLGLTVAVSRFYRAISRNQLTRVLSISTLAALVTAALAPSVAAGLGRQQAFDAIPSYWHQTARWLDAQPDEGSVLVLPPSSFADFVWGTTKDDPLQALMQRPLVQRDAVPLGSAGATRMLDAIVRQVGTGSAGTELITALRAAGITYVIVRADISPKAVGDPTLATYASMESAGLPLVKTFGPSAGRLSEDEGNTVDYRTHLDRSLVEVYAVPDATHASMQAVSDLPLVRGGPEDVARIGGRDTLALVGSDGLAVATDRNPTVLTDGLRRREVDFGAVTHNQSEVLASTAAPKQARAAHDYESDPIADKVTTSWTGVRGVHASSSAADAAASVRLGPSSRPGAALDGDPSTRWVSGRAGRAIGEWLEVTLDPEVTVRQVSVTFSASLPVIGQPTSVRVDTDTGSRDVPTSGTLGPVLVTLPAGTSRFVRVTLTGVTGANASGFSIAELGLTFGNPRERLSVPSVDSADLIVLGRDGDGRDGCLTVEERTLCAPHLAVPDEGPATLGRRLDLGQGGTYSLEGQVRARDSAAVDRLFTRSDRMRATASSRLVEGPRDRPEAAIDRDLATAWIAGTHDFQPTFTVKLPSKREVWGLEFVVPRTLAASRPKMVRLTFADGSVQDVEVREDGAVDFDPVVTDSIRMEFGATYPLVDADSRSGDSTFVPVGFAEARVQGADDLTASLAPSAASGSRCGFGPTLMVGDKKYLTAVRGTVGDVLAGKDLAWTLCDAPAVTLPSGPVTVDAVATEQFEVTRLRLVKKPSLDGAPAAENVTVTSDGPAGLRLQVPERTADSVVAVPQNFNAGWTAKVDGRDLQAVRVNGWMQGWLVPQGSAVILTAEFGPNATFRMTMAGGAVTLVMWLGLLGALNRARPRDGVAVQAAGHRLPVALGVATIGFAWGWVGLIAGIVVLAMRASRPQRLVTRVVIAVLVLAPSVAALAVALDPWPEGRLNVDSWMIQLLIVVAVVMTFFSSVVVRRAPGRPADASGTTS